jgi:hypothetical protein
VRGGVDVNDSATFPLAIAVFLIGLIGAVLWAIL